MSLPTTNPNGYGQLVPVPGAPGLYYTPSNNAAPPFQGSSAAAAASAITAASMTSGLPPSVLYPNYVASTNVYPNNNSNSDTHHHHDDVSAFRKCWDGVGDLFCMRITPVCLLMSCCILLLLALLFGGVIWWSINSAQIINLQDDVDSINSQLDNLHECLTCSDAGNATIHGSLNVVGQLGATSAVFGAPLPPISKRFTGVFVPNQYAAKFLNDQHMEPGTAIWATNQTVGVWFDVIQTVLDAWQWLAALQVQIDLTDLTVAGVQGNVSALQTQVANLNSSVVGLIASDVILSTALANEIATREAQDNLRMRYMGTYSGVATYVPNDVVTYTADSSWIALLNSTGVAPSTSSPNWQVLSFGNLTGPAGPPGPGFTEGLNLRMFGTESFTDTSSHKLVFNVSSGIVNYANLTVQADGDIIIPTDGVYTFSLTLMITNTTAADAMTSWSAWIAVEDNLANNDSVGQGTYSYAGSSGTALLYSLSFTHSVAVTNAPQVWQVWTAPQVTSGTFTSTSLTNTDNMLSIRRIG